MSLAKYHKKRNFGVTPEPRGRVGRGPGHALAFVVQKHAASHLHYDFRLELNGVLLSWAVPKGPSADPADRRLAMHVEDHPLEYGSFEGTIPAKQYGGGTVMLWDQGTWIAQGDAAADYASGRLKFELDGAKLKGGWMLVHSHSGKYGGKRADDVWFLIKERDRYAHSGDPIVDTAPDSVTSGRSLQQIADNQDRIWNSNRSAAQNVRAGAVKPARPTRADARSSEVKAGVPAGARRAKLPATLLPMLATLVKAAPSGDGWLHEIKYDGYRMLARVEGGRARIYSRSGKEWTHALRPVAKALATLPLTSGWIDGEVTVADAQGRTSFQRLQNALSGEKPAGLTYFVFDLPFANGYDLRKVPLHERKAMLRALLDPPPEHVRFGVEIEAEGAQVFAQACGLGLEGIISKRLDGAYLPTRSRDWVKVKCGHRQEMVIGGFTEPQGGRHGFGALLLGVYAADGTLRYSGRVGTGFDDAALARMAPMLKKLEAAKVPFDNPPRGYAAKGVHWVKPLLVAEVAFTEWTEAGTLRHPSFQGLRDDKRAQDVVREQPQAAPAHSAHATPAAAAPPAAKKTATTQAKTTARAAKATPRTRRKAVAAAPSRMTQKSSTASAGNISPAKTSAAKAGVAKARLPKPAGSPGAKLARDAKAPVASAAPARAITQAAKTVGDDVIEGVRLSHPDKLYFDEAGITKRDVAQYFAAVAPHMLPHIAGRPLALLRCPDGWRGECFYQKHAPPSLNAAVGRIEVPESSGTGTYSEVHSAAGLIGLLQWGVIEIHPWGSRAPKLQRPDRLVFDFDPDDAVEWPTLVDAVGVLRKLLDELALPAYVKTTGGKGLHVVVPIRPTVDWSVAKDFTRAVAELMVKTFPERFVSTISKARRKDRIFIDYLRNAEGSTAIAPYGLRARANAPVATPVAWEEVTPGADIRFDHFNLRTLPQRLAAQRSDPWRDIAQRAVTLSVAMRKRVGAA
ncbi:MAG: non-homologous end-joining DNA ligase [Casimicrobiaceae bacterium]